MVKKQQSRIPPPDAKPPPVAAAPAAPQQMVLGYDPSGPKESVDIVSSKDSWSEFQLDDGTVIRAKAVVLDVKKMTGQFNNDGDPIYELQLTMVNQARVPDHLKKKD